jgi:transposase-like protein
LNEKWVYIDRAVDKYGQTIDFLLRAKRDAVVAKALFTKTFKQYGIPEKVTVDKSGRNKSALEKPPKLIKIDKEEEEKNDDEEPSNIVHLNFKTSNSKPNRGDEAEKSSKLSDKNEHGIGKKEMSVTKTELPEFTI